MRYVADKAIEGLNVEKATKLEEIIRDPVSSVQGRMRLQAADLWQYVIRLLLRKKLSAKLKSETQGRLRTSKPMTELVGISCARSLHYSTNYGGGIFIFSSRRGGSPW